MTLTGQWGYSQIGFLFKDNEWDESRVRVWWLLCFSLHRPCRRSESRGSVWSYNETSMLETFLRADRHRSPRTRDWSSSDSRHHWCFDCSWTSHRALPVDVVDEEKHSVDHIKDLSELNLRQWSWQSRSNWIDHHELSEWWRSSHLVLSPMFLSEKQESEEDELARRAAGCQDYL